MHRTAVLKLLRAHATRPLDLHEAAMTAATIHFVEAHADCLLRSQLSGHLTGSAWVVDTARTRTLLTHHRKLDLWLQLGGHADGGTGPGGGGPARGAGGERTHAAPAGGGGDF
jgi:hypothetical protein